jgi:ketosteroid isomerase-like protein
MKNLIFLIITSFIVMLSSCSSAQSTTNGIANNDNSQTVVNRSKELKAIGNVLEQYITANENEDLTLMESLWAPDADIILIGTTGNSPLMGWNNIMNAYKKQYEVLDNIYISASEQYVKLNKQGDNAWFVEILNYNYMKDGKAKKLSGLRFTGVLQKCEDGKWRFVQAHLSSPLESD